MSMSMSSAWPGLRNRSRFKPKIGGSRFSGRGTTGSRSDELPEGFEMLVKMTDEMDPASLEKYVNDTIRARNREAKRRSRRRRSEMAERASESPAPQRSPSANPRATSRRTSRTSASADPPSLEGHMAFSSAASSSMGSVVHSPFDQGGQPMTLPVTQSLHPQGATASWARYDTRGSQEFLAQRQQYESQQFMQTPQPVVPDYALTQGQGMMQPATARWGMPMMSQAGGSSQGSPTGSHREIQYPILQETHLQQAAAKGEIEIVRFLISRGVEVDAADSEGNRALHKAVQNGHSIVAKILIDNDADVNAANSRGFCPLRLAIESGDKEMVEMLCNNVCWDNTLYPRSGAWNM